VVTYVDVSSSEVAHMPYPPTNDPSPLILPNNVQPLTYHPVGLLHNYVEPNGMLIISTHVSDAWHGSPTSSPLGSAERVAAGRDVPAAAAENMYESLLYCTTALPLFCFLCCDDRALHCPPRSSGILCECARVDYLSLSTSFNEPHLQVHGVPLFELLFERCDIVVIRVDVSSSEVSHMPYPPTIPAL
jgi:hypothetical protein